MKHKKILALALCMISVLGLLSGCASQETAVDAAVVSSESEPAVLLEDPAVYVTEINQDDAVVESEAMLDIDLGVIPLSGEPALVTVLMPVASGVTVYENARAVIDASNIADGYVMVKTLEEATARYKVVVTGPSGTAYYYDLDSAGDYEVYPLSDGNGTYQVQVCKNVTGTSYAISQSATLSVTLKDEFAPFLLPNQYVNYTAQSNTVAVAAQLVAGKETELEKIQAVYTYVVENLHYDQERAATVTSGYLPELDSVLAEGKGICFDYAALMTAMLRSQGVPCKLVVGYAGSAYHAWINTYSDSEGWMDSVIYFDGTSWKLMDPTFASTSNSDASVMAYIGDGGNYTEKYLY